MRRCHSSCATRSPGWFILAGETADLPDDERADREQIERFFLASTLAFLAGSVLLALVRNVFAVFSLGLEMVLTSMTSLSSQRIDLIAVCFFCPAFTVLIFWLEERFMSRLAGSAGVAVPTGREVEQRETARQIREKRKSAAVDKQLDTELV